MNIARLKYFLFHFSYETEKLDLPRRLTWTQTIFDKRLQMFILLRNTLAYCKSWQAHQLFFFTWLILFRTLFLLYLTVNWNALKLRNETDFIAFSIKHFNIRLIFRYALLIDGLFRHLYGISNFWHFWMKLK